MPPVIAAAVVAGGVAAGAAALGLTALTVGAAFWSAAISTAIFGGVSYMLQKRPSAPNLSDHQRGLQQTVRAPAASRRLLYGRVRVGGTLVFAESTGPRNDLLHLAIAVAGHEISSVEQVQINDLPSDDERYVKKPAISASGLRFVADSNDRYGEVTNGYWDTYIDVISGVSRQVWVETGPRLDQSGFTSGQVLRITGTVNDGLYRIRATGNQDVYRRHIKVERIDSGRIVSEVPTGAVTLQETYLSINSHLGGANQTADPDMVAGLADWTSDHRLRGIAYLYARLAYHDNVWLSGIPNITAIIRGKKIYDPRTGRTEYSANPALIIADYLTTPRPAGLGVPYSDIDEGWLIASANICDEIAGEVTINFPRPPNWPKLPPMVLTRRRYECHAAIEMSEDREQVLNKLAGTMAGTVVFTGGKWRIQAGAYQTPTVHLDESHLRDRLRVQPRLSRQELANSVRGTYVSAVDEFQPADFPPVQDQNAIAQDNGETIWHDLEFPYTTNVWNAQQLARIHLAKTRQQMTVQYPCTLAGLKAVAGGTIQISNARMGWERKVFDVVDWRLATYEDADGNPLLGVDLTLRETAPHVYQVGALFPDEPSPPTNLPSPWDIAPVEDLTVSSGLDAYTVDANGDIRSRARVEWVPSPDPRVIQYEVQYRREDEDAWNTVISLGAYMHIEPVYHGEELEVRVRPRTGLGSGPWVLVEHTVVAVSKIDGEEIIDVLPVPDVRGLELYGQANNTDFAGRDAKFVWRESSITEWEALGWGAAKLGARDLYFRDYEVTVHDIETGQIRRTEHVVDPEYTYSYERNVEDSQRLGIAGPRRQFRVEVVARGRQSQVSRMPARLTVQNPAPELPAGWALTPGYFEASASFLIPDDTDFRRINVYASTQQGFTPSASNRVWQGSDSPARIADLAQDTAYYYRYEAEDAFGPGAMSGELSFTTKQLSMPDVSGVQEAISGVEDWLREHDDEFEVLENDITSAQQAIANETEARTVQYNALDARVTDNETGLASKASITYVDDAVAGEASARATAISQVSAELGDVGVAVTAVSTALADLETGLSAEYTLTVDAGGNVTGIKLRSGESGSSMVLQADAFAIATQGGAKYPFTIENDNITFNGRVSFSNVEGRPTSLADLDSDAATKLGGIAAGADKTKTVIDGGLVTTGYIQLATAGNIRSGKSSYADTASGWWLGNDSGTSKMHIGEGSRSMRWDGSSLILGEEVELRGANSYYSRSVFYLNQFNGLGGIRTNAQNGLTVSTEGDHLRLRTAANQFSRGGIWKNLLISANELTWDKPRRFKCAMSYTASFPSDHIVRIGVGSTPPLSISFGNFFGFYYTGGVWHAFSRRNGVSTFQQAVPSFPTNGANVVAEAVFIPGDGIYFYVDDVLVAQTNNPDAMPAQHPFGNPSAEYVLMNIFLNKTGATPSSASISIGEWMFFQDA